VNYYEELETLEKKRVAAEKEEEEEGLKLFQNAVSKQKSPVEAAAAKSLSIFSLEKGESSPVNDDDSKKKKHKREKVNKFFGSKKIKINEHESVEVQKHSGIENEVSEKSGLTSLLEYGDESCNDEDG
jgi:hypothetical protein